MICSSISLPYGRSSLEISIDPAHLNAVLRSGLHDYQPDVSAGQLIQRFELHFISEGFFARQELMPLLQVGIQHDEGRFGIGTRMDHGGNLRNVQDPAYPFSAMAGKDLKPTVNRTDDDRLQNAVGGDAFEQIQEFFVFSELKRTRREIVEQFKGEKTQFFLHNTNLQNRIFLKENVPFLLKPYPGMP